VLASEMNSTNLWNRSIYK